MIEKEKEGEGKQQPFAIGSLRGRGSQN